MQPQAVVVVAVLPGVEIDGDDFARSWRDEPLLIAPHLGTINSLRHTHYGRQRLCLDASQAHYQRADGRPGTICNHRQTAEMSPSFRE